MERLGRFCTVVIFAAGAITVQQYIYAKIMMDSALGQAPLAAIVLSCILTLGLSAITFLLGMIGLGIICWIWYGDSVPKSK